jgi:hypothetical protein
VVRLVAALDAVVRITGFAAVTGNSVLVGVAKGAYRGDPGEYLLTVLARRLIAEHVCSFNLK